MPNVDSGGWEPPEDMAADLISAGRSWWGQLTPYEQVFWEVLVAHEGPVSTAKLVDELSAVDSRVKAPLGPWINKALNKGTFGPLYRRAFGEVDQGHYWHSATPACRNCLPLQSGEFAAAAGMRWLVTRILDSSTRLASVTTVTKDPHPRLFTVYYNGDEDDGETFLLAARESAGAGDLIDVEMYSPRSALGAAVLSAAPGDTVTYTGPTGRSIEVTIVSVEPFRNDPQG